LGQRRQRSSKSGVGVFLVIPDLGGTVKLSVMSVDRVKHESAGWLWVVRYSVQRDEGDTAFQEKISLEHSVFVHAFPEERILSLLVEYDLSDEDMNSLLDVALAEPFLDPNDGEPTLHSDEDFELIKEAHLRRCARVKWATRLSSRGIRNPVEMIRQFPRDKEKLKEISDFLRSRTTRKVKTHG
jgi:hypothetical protein